VREQHRVAALAAVARGDDRLSVLAPRRDHALDRLGREVGAVREHDDSGLGVERGQAAAERRPRPSLPVGTADDARVGLDVVGAEDDDDVLDGRTSESLQDLRKEEPLFRRAEACGRSSGENDCPDQVQPRSERQAALTFAT
jgi:hypothetical protein